MENFYIGQDIVAIRNHSLGKFKEGDHFVIQGLKKGCCDFIKLEINIGHTEDSCCCCNCGDISSDGISWYGSQSFKPLDELTNIEELKEVLNEPIFK